MEDESSETTSTERGNVGNEIFDQVEKLMADEGLSRTQAFQRLSDMTGRRAGTVAANYYRVARQRGAALQPRAPRGSRSGGGARKSPGRKSSRASGDVEAALQRATASIQELAGLVRNQQRELDELREQTKVLEQLRTLMN
ncbi:MAG TPA: hypothetical protein PKD59_12310 [Miltoncostaeaceae bacterium]|nr:hypothetical protein [Miltoncostaeaceae bacterium]